MDLRKSTYIPPIIHVMESALNKSKYDPKGIAQINESLISPNPILPLPIMFKIK